MARLPVAAAAQGLPRTYIDDLGDPYQEQIERSVVLLTSELSKRGINNKHSVGYQGQFGPERLRWIETSTSSEIRRLG